MLEIKAIIADDEKQLRSYLKSRLSAVWPDLIISGEAGNGRDALELIEKQCPDIAFLDIKMPGPSGMEVAKRVAGTCRVVFITAYDQYAVEAFENEAIDYLLKPVTDERLKATVKRLRNQISASSEPPDNMVEIVERLITSLRTREVPDYLQWIKVQYGDSVRLIPVDEVYYFKAGDKYTVVITKGSESLIKKSIMKLSEELDPKKFWRIHRGTIVNVSCINKVGRSLTGRGLVKLKDRSEFLTVSRTYSHLFKQM